MSVARRFSCEIVSSERTVATIVVNMPATTTAIRASAVNKGARKLRGRTRTEGRGDISVPSIGRKPPKSQPGEGSAGQRPDYAMKILIVDDEPGTRLVVASAVQRLGHTAAQAGDGMEGWQAFEALAPEVVITDWAMPGLDGTELTARIRASEAGYTYIMVLTARADETASRAAVEAGAAGRLPPTPAPPPQPRGVRAAARLRTMH